MIKSGIYLGQSYDPATPIRPDAYAIAKLRETTWLAARHFLFNQQRQLPCTGIFERIGPQSDWTFHNGHDAIHHGDMLEGRCMEHVRR